MNLDRSWHNFIDRFGPAVVEAAIAVCAIDGAVTAFWRALRNHRP